MMCCVKWTLIKCLIRCQTFNKMIPYGLVVRSAFVVFCDLGIQKDGERVRSSLSPSWKWGVDWSSVIFSLQLTSLDQKWKLGCFSAAFLENNIPANLCLFLFDLLYIFKYLVVLIVLTLYLLFHSPLRANPLLQSFHITITKLLSLCCRLPWWQASLPAELSLMPWHCIFDV